MVEPDFVTEDMMTKPKPSFSLLVTVTSYGNWISIDRLCISVKLYITYLQMQKIIHTKTLVYEFEYDNILEVIQSRNHQ